MWSHYGFKWSEISHYFFENKSYSILTLQAGETCSSRLLKGNVLLWQVRGRGQPDNIIVYGNAKFNIGGASCDPVSWEHSSSSSCVLSSCHGHHGPLPCLFLGEWISDQRLAISTSSTSWFSCQGSTIAAHY